MRLHANAALTLRQRRRMVALVVDEGWSVKDAAAEFKTSAKACSKWVSRFREGAKPPSKETACRPRPRPVEASDSPHAVRSLARLRCCPFERGVA